MENIRVPLDAPGVAPRRTADDRRHSPSRERVLREIERRGSASTTELVDATGLHENTVRGHLKRLLADGYVRRMHETPAGRGRPPIRWVASTTEAGGAYAGLAAALAESLATSPIDARAAARDAGTAWGTRLVGAEGDSARSTRHATAPPDAPALVERVMREQGFAPRDADADAESDAASESPLLALHRCPLLAAAAKHPDIVCAVHEGMIEGIARASDPDARARIDAFAEGGVCLVHLRSAS